MKRVSALAEQHGQTAYDATYLELAMRLGLPLATLDRNFYKVAAQEGVAYEMASAEFLLRFCTLHKRHEFLFCAVKHV